MQASKPKAAPSPESLTMSLFTSKTSARIVFNGSHFSIEIRGLDGHTSTLSRPLAARIIDNNNSTAGGRIVEFTEPESFPTAYDAFQRLENLGFDVYGKRGFLARLGGYYLLKDGHACCPDCDPVEVPANT